MTPGCLIRCAVALVLVFGVSLASPGARAMDVNVSAAARNSTSNPGPFSSGLLALVNINFRIDGSIAPTGAVPTWQGALNDLVLTIDDDRLGSFTITAQGGRWQQMLRTNTHFLFAGWGGIFGGTLSPFEVVNPAWSATPFVLTFVEFELRGPSLLASETILPAALNIGDFSYLSLVLHFSNADPAVSVIQKSSIIRNTAFSAVDVSPVPEPSTLLAMLAGLGVVALRVRTRLRCTREAA